MSTDTTKAMQEALQAAVSRMNNGAAAPPTGGMPVDMMGMLMSVVPKLLQGSESSKEMAEKLETQSGDLTSLREQTQILRKQCYRLTKAQEQLLAKIDEIQKEQTAIGRAVLDLAQHMARITFIDDAPADDDDEYGRESAYAHDGHRRAEFRVNGNGHGKKPRTAAEHGSASRAGRVR